MRVDTLKPGNKGTRGFYSKRNQKKKKKTVAEKMNNEAYKRL